MVSVGLEDVIGPETIDGNHQDGICASGGRHAEPTQQQGESGPKAAVCWSRLLNVPHALFLAESD